MDVIRDEEDAAWLEEGREALGGEGDGGEVVVCQYALHINPSAPCSFSQ